MLRARGMKAWVAVHQLLSAIDGKVRQFVWRLQFTPEDVALLALLELNKKHNGYGMTCSLLAERVGRARQNVQASLRRLQRLGLVDTWTDEDERAGGWSLTELGVERWEAACDELTKLEERVFGSPIEARRAVDWFEQLKANLRIEEPWHLKRIRDDLEIAELASALSEREKEGS
ncbi:MAG: helix-turn-helix domain-containing protein [Archangium sp.]